MEHRGADAVARQPPRASSWRRRATSCCRPSCSCCRRSRATATTWPRGWRSCASAGSTVRACTAPSPSWSATASSSRGPATPKAGQARRVYGLTDQGQRALRAWMGVIKQERDCLDQVLRRYVATGTIDAVLAEAEGSWAAVTGHPWSPVSSTSRIERRRAGIRSVVRSRPRRGAAPSRSSRWRALTSPVGRAGGAGHRPGSGSCPSARSCSSRPGPRVGPITFGAIGVTGTIEAEVRDGVVRAGQPSVGPPRGRGDPAPLRQRAVRRRAAATHRRPAPPGRRPRPPGVHRRRRRATATTWTVRSRSTASTRPLQGTVGRRAHVRRQAGRQRRAGVRHPGLRHRLARPC